MLQSQNYIDGRPPYLTDFKNKKSIFLPNKKHSNLLDIGCGPGRSIDWYKNYTENIYCIDPDSENIKIIKNNYNYLNNCNFTVGRGEDIPYAGIKFDAIVCAGSLDWINLTEFCLELDRIADKDTVYYFIWSWYDTRDEKTRSFYNIARNLLGANLGPSPDEVLRKGRFILKNFKEESNSFKHSYDKSKIVKLIDSSSYWKENRRCFLNESLDSFFTEDSVDLEFREYIIYGTREK